jgi:hypothetical protein
MRTIKYQRDYSVPMLVENPFKAYALTPAILSMGSLAMVDTGLRFDDDVALRVVRGLSDAIAVIGVYRRGKEVWLALTTYNRVDGMSIQPGCPLAEVEASVPQEKPELVRFLDFTGGKRGPIGGSSETTQPFVNKRVMEIQETCRDIDPPAVQGSEENR